MKTLYFETPPPCLSLVYSLSLSELYPREKGGGVYEEFLFRGEKVEKKQARQRGGQTHQKALSFFLSSVLFVFVRFFRSAFIIHFIFQFIPSISRRTHTQHISNWKTTLDTHT